MRMNTRTLALPLACLLVFTGCSDDDDEDAQGEQTTTSTAPSAESTTTSTATPTTGVAADTTCGTEGRSPAQFDPAAGTYATYVKAVDVAERSVSFDVVQFLTGEEADAAYEQETGQTGGVPNGVYIQNDSEQVRDLPVAADAKVLYVRFDIDDLTPKPGPFEELPAKVKEINSPYWITVKDSVILSLCEQYLP